MHKRDDFRAKVIGHKVCVLIFYTNLSGTFLIPRKTKRDMTTNVHRASRKVPAVNVTF